jgi:2-hydroxychromene-2-carboxylate isomerase
LSILQQYGIQHISPGWTQLARPYFLKDSARVAAFHDMPFRRPVPDLIDQDPTTLAIAADQPHARRLGRLGIAATERGRGFEFCSEVAAENDRLLRAPGHWGVPTMVFEGELFFGQDRFDLLLWRMKQRGLEPLPPSVDELR